MSVSEIKVFIEQLIREGNSNYYILSSAQKIKGNSLNDYSQPNVYIDWVRDKCNKKIPQL